MKKCINCEHWRNLLPLSELDRNFKRIADAYDLPKNLGVGTKIIYLDGDKPTPGVIVGNEFMRLWAKLDGWEQYALLNPTWNVTYIEYNK